jgi:hypothetical protein
MIIENNWYETDGHLLPQLITLPHVLFFRVKGVKSPRGMAS